MELTDYLDENHTKYKAARYFKNNNSYVLYERSEKGKKHKYLCLENQMLTLEYPKYMNENQKYISFPYPSCKGLSDFKIEDGKIVVSILHGGIELLNEMNLKSKSLGRKMKTFTKRNFGSYIHMRI